MKSQLAPVLLELIHVTGAIITLDSMGDQTEIVRLIRQKKPDYVVTLKKNHPTLYKQVKTWFETVRANQCAGIEVSEDSRTEKAHPESRN